MENSQVKIGHRMILEGRKFCRVTGVKDVISFEVGSTLLETEMGMLDIRGSELHMSRLDLEQGEIDIDGNFIGFTYSAAEHYNKPGESLFKRMFK